MIEKQMQKIKRRRQETLSLTQRVKILVSFAQILLVFQPAFRFQLPETLERFVRYLRLLALDVFSFVTPGCLFRTDLPTTVPAWTSINMLAATFGKADAPAKYREPFPRF